MSGQLKPAKLTPYQRDGKNLDEEKAILLDFNPESLAIQVKSGQEADRGRRGRQQTQHVAKSTATLSFDALFDTTRPNPSRRQDQGINDDPEKLDVQHKTLAIANLLQNEGEGENAAPRRVRFHWGTVIFDGKIDSFNETLDYFSPEGVPLRSKIKISITEQDFRYKVDAEQVQASRKPPAVDDANSVAGNNDLDSLFDLSPSGGFNFDPSLYLSLDIPAGASSSAGIDANLDVELGLAVDLGVSAVAGVSLSTSAAFDVFGADILTVSLDGDIDLGVVAGGGSKQTATLISENARGDAARPPNAWAPDGPQAGSQATQLAARINEQRNRGQISTDAAVGVAEVAISNSVAVAEGRSNCDVSTPFIPSNPLPVRGSPPLVPAYFGPPLPKSLFGTRQSPRPTAAPNGYAHRPSWEELLRSSSEASSETDNMRACSCCPKRQIRSGRW